MSRAIGRVAWIVGRTIIVAGATAAAGALLTAAGSIVLAIAQGGDPRTALGFLWYWLPPLLLVPFAVVAGAIPLVGLPAMALLRSLDMESARAYAVSGMIGGLLLSPLLTRGAGPLPAGPIILACSIYGALAGTLFRWLLRPSDPGEAERNEAS